MNSSNISIILIHSDVIAPLLVQFLVSFFLVFTLCERSKPQHYVKVAMNILTLLYSIVILFTYLWSPVLAVENGCGQYKTNETCLAQGSCNCAFIICNGTS